MVKKIRKEHHLPMTSNSAFFHNLPSEIIIDILSRLPTRTIIGCKRVCSEWLKLILSAEFGKWHLPRSSLGILVHVNPKNGTLFKIGEFGSELDFQHHDLHYKPLMDIDVNTSPDTTIKAVGSVDGLVCFLKRGSEWDDLFMCNLVTREYIPLPRLNGCSKWPNVFMHGVGRSVSSGQYKVIRILQKNVTPHNAVLCLRGCIIECQVYTLGTGLWRSIAPCEPSKYYWGDNFGVSVNGNLHWLVTDASSNNLISCFDLETELFTTFSLPFQEDNSCNDYLTVLEDCLCYYEPTEFEVITIWIMKKYGVVQSWTKSHVIIDFPDIGVLLAPESVNILKVFNDGDILLFWEKNHLVYYCIKTKTTKVVDLFEVDLFEDDIERFIRILLHSSSFVSLKSFERENVISF